MHVERMMWLRESGVLLGQLCGTWRAPALGGGAAAPACTPARSSEVPLVAFFRKPLPHQAPEYPEFRGQDVQWRAACLCCLLHAHARLLTAHPPLLCPRPCNVPATARWGSQDSRCGAQERADYGPVVYLLTVKYEENSTWRLEAAWYEQYELNVQAGWILLLQILETSA